MGVSILPGTDLSVLARDLSESHRAIMNGSRPAVAPSPDVADSWQRARSSGSSALDTHRPAMIPRAELAGRRVVHPVREAVDRLQGLFADAVDDADMAMGIFDADGTLLWRGGSPSLLAVADQLQLVEGSRWDEDSVATTAVGLAVRTQQRSRVFGAEHYSPALHDLYCTAAPIHDRRTGAMVAIAGLAGPAMALQPAASAFTDSLAALGEHEMSAAHLIALADLRGSGAPQLAGVRGPALLVDDDGWVAESRGCTAPTRVAAPTEDMRQFVPGIGMCSAERLTKGWLLRRAGPPGPVLAELDLRGEPSITVSGDESWRTVLTPRHAQIIVHLADAGESGLTADRLSRQLFGDSGHLVTVRAEMSRLRRAVGSLILSRPYRLAPGIELVVRSDLADREQPGTRRDGRRRHPA